MTNQDKSGIRDADDLSGRDLQQSQAIAPSTGEFARDRMQDGSGGEQQGGGRDVASISRRAGSDPAEDRQLDEEADALLEDQQQHQDRGQGSIADAQQR